ncbi:MAG: hypothetical protein HKN28_05240 [Alphaproteobacteria bacterium]|nr:hypothetical protein [Alphaproteobacteria bacterium]
MKLLKLMLVAAVITGGIYHAEVADFFGDIATGSKNSTISRSVTGSFNKTGKSSNSLMDGVGGSLSR